EMSFAENNSRSNRIQHASIHTSRRYDGVQFNQQKQQQQQQPRPQHMELSTANVTSQGRPMTRTAMHAFAISQIISPPDPADPLNSAAADLTCGNCQPNGPCACVEEALRSVQTGVCGK